MRRILVLRGGALGDFIVTLPALFALRQQWPAAEITLIGNTTAAELARKRGVLDALYSQHEARWSRLFDRAPLPAELKTWLSDFDLVVSYWPDPDGALSHHFPTRVGQHFVATTAMPVQAPAAMHYAEPLGGLGLAVESTWCRIEKDRITWGEKTAARAPRLGRTTPADDRPIIIHLGSGSPRKNWPADRWLTLIERVDAPVRVILGEVERERWDPAVLSRLDHVQLIVGRSVEGLITEFRHCRLFLGHDSGVSHLAAAAGIESILLFGPTDPAVWAPPAPHVTVLRAGDEMATLTITAVESAIETVLQRDRL